tara:strand:+ start:104 stop:622 length:519 start_codon:yes stop_codon:yes gene_type:complete
MTAKWKEVSAYTGRPMDEDAPTNFGGQGSNISMPPDAAMSKKKKKLLDARTKEYKAHQARLERARARRLENRKASQFSKKIQENIMDFNRESLLTEDNLKVLRSIVKSKQNKPVKMKDGSMKVDLFTASAITKVYDAIKQQSNKEKFDRMLNGSKAQFMKIADFAMSQVKMR